MKHAKILFCLLALLLINSCSTSRITYHWKVPDFKAKQYHKVMVVGIIREADMNIRQNMEDHLVGDLRDLGYNVYSSLQEYGPKTFEGMNEESVNKKLAQEGFDAVVTIVLLDKQRERYYVPGRMVYTPYYTYHNHFWGYYRSVYGRIETPGYYQVYTKYFWESNLYDLTENKLLYSVQTESFDPSSMEKLAHEYGQLIVQSMVSNNILQKQITTQTKAM